jgi:hypothetical protein
LELLISDLSLFAAAQHWWILVAKEKICCFLVFFFVDRAMVQRPTGIDCKLGFQATWGLASGREQLKSKKRHKPDVISGSAQTKTAYFLL